MGVGLLLGALVFGGGMLMAGGGGKKKKKPSASSAAPTDKEIAQALADAEERGEVIVTDDGEIVEVQPDPATEQIAAELAEAEAAGQVVVNEDGDVATKTGPQTWELPPNWNAILELRPDGDPAELLQMVLDQTDALFYGTGDGNNFAIVGGDEEPVTLTLGQQLWDAPIYLEDVTLLSKSEAMKALKKARKLAQNGLGTDEATKEAESVIKDAEARGEVVVTDEGDVIPTATGEEAAAQELANAEARGEVVVTDDGEIIEASAEPATEDEVAQELANAEARGEVEVTPDGDVVQLTGPDPRAQALADLLVDAERTMGSLWKSSHQAEVQAWQIQQGTDWQGKPLKPDGQFGKTGALTLASLGVDVIPLVRYWPKGANQQTAVTEYKVQLQSLPTADPEAVGEALVRERGRGFGKAAAIPPGEQAS